MQTSKKLLVVIPYFPPNAGGGAEKYAYNISRRLSRDYHWDVVVITTATSSASPAISRTNGLKIYRLPYKFKLSNSPFSVGWHWKIKKIIKAEKPDLINVQSPVPGIGDVAAALSRLPLVVTYHMGTMKKYKSSLNSIIWLYENIFLKRMLSKASGIICSSDYVRNDFLVKYRYKSQTITPAVDSKFFHPASKPPKHKNILFVGALSRGDKHKGLDILLKATQTLRKEFPDLRITVVGGGEGVQQFKQMAHTLGLDESVTFTGRLEGGPWAAAYRGATVIAHPSSNDSFPLVITEAMASGLPVVSTTAGGIPTLVENEVEGLLVRPRDVAAFTEALRRILRDPGFAKKLGQAGRLKAVTELEWSKKTQETNAVFNRTIGIEPRQAKTKVAQVTAYFDKRYGNIAEYAKMVALHIKHSKSHDAFIVTRQHASRKFIVSNIEGVTIYTLPALFWFPLGLINPFRSRKIKKIFEHEQPDIVQLHVPSPNMASATLSAAKNLPVVLTYHVKSMMKRKLLSGTVIKLYERLSRDHLFKDAAAVFIVSPQLLHESLQKFRYKTLVVMPRIKPAIFSSHHKKNIKSNDSSATSGKKSAEDIAITGLSNAGSNQIWEVHLAQNQELLDSVLQHPLNIVQLAAYYPPHLGGVEVVTQELSQELAIRGNRVQVLTSNIGAKHSPGQEQGTNFKVDRLNGFEFAHTPFVFSLFRQLWHVKKPAVFHLHLSQIFFPEIMWAVAKLRGIPYVVHFHLDVGRSSRFVGYAFLLYKRIFWPVVLRGAAHVIVLSPEQAAMVRTRYGLDEKKVTYIPNGVSQKFLKIGEKSRTIHKPLRLFYLGRLDKQKHFDRMIEAMALVKSNVKLDIVGDGEERSKLENLTAQLKLSNVTFHGPKLGDERLYYYKQADVFVLPSDKEGMPLVMFEAMASGLPVIGSDVQGIREHLRDVGILVSNPTPVTFAAAIDEFYGNREKLLPKLSKLSKEKAAQYSWSLLSDKIESIYRNLTAAKGGTQKISWKFFAGIAAWWLAFLCLRGSQSAPEFITNAVGFSFLALVPGWLSTRCLRLANIPAVGKIIVAVGFSVLELMLTGLIGNTLLQLFGIARPLDSAYVLSGVTLLVFVLGLSARKYGVRNARSVFTSIRQLFRPGLDLYFIFIPLLFVALSIMGATTLNNGGSGNITLIMLVAMAIFALTLALKSSRLRDSTVVSAIFTMSLSLLLMTSLRGWFTTGHDIQVEYHVFEMAKTNGVWQIQIFRQPYNACLSITILPTMLANMLKTLDPYVFKIYFQILFAICPVAVYLLARNWLSKGLAFLATLYFISFPTFFTDMPFLNRQEIAFVFLSLMLYITFLKDVGLFLRRLLFLLFGFGLVLSHYSTTYSVILIMVISLCLWLPIRKIGVYLRRSRIFAKSSLQVLHTATNETRRFSWTVIIILVIGSFIWTSVLTQTGNNTVLVVKETVGALRAGLQGQKLKSNDTNYSLSSFAAASPKQELNAYVKQQIMPQEKRFPGIFYSPTTYRSYAVKPASDDTMPLTKLGKYLSAKGFDVTSFNNAFRQLSAKILQVFVLSGFVYVLFRRTYSKLFSSDYLALALGSAIFVALQVFLPVLSVEYGLLRAFQQSLMVLGILTVLGSVALFAWLPSKRLKIAAPILLALLFFVSNTGVITQTLGGYLAQLNLNNAGQYYDIYYTHKQEIAGVQWLSTVAGSTHNGIFAQNSPVQFDQYTYGKLVTYTNLTSDGDIYPATIIKNAYVFLGYANVQDKQATISYNGDLVTYSYPAQFLDKQKDLIYANGGADVYR